MQHFEHDGIELAYDDRGCGPALLFLHNGGASSTIWRHQVDVLSRGTDLAGPHRTVAVDLPGFGCAPRRQPIDLDDHVEVLGALIDELDLAPVVLVGNCMGSNIATRIAERRPNDTAALILVNPLTEATFSAGGLGLLHKVQRVLPGPSSFGRRVSRRIVPPDAAARLTVRFQVGAKGVARGVHRDPALIAGNKRRDQLPALVDVLDDLQAYGALDAEGVGVDVPICTIWGAQNRVLSPRAGRALDERLQPERAEVLDGCGHFPMLEDPDAVTDIISTFAAAHRPAVTNGASA